MNSLYLISKRNIANLKQKLALKFKNIATFEINFNEKAFLNSQRDEILTIIENFQNIKKMYDFVIVLGVNNSKIIGKNELNLSLARHLNCPIFEYKILNELKAMNTNSKLLISDNLDEILSYKHEIITQTKFEFNLAQKAKNLQKHIILPESEDWRILSAASKISAKNLVKLTLLGNENLTKKNAQKLGISLDNIEFLDPQTSELSNKFAEQIFELRKAKGVSFEQAQKLAKERNYFATMCVRNSIAHGVVSGAVGTTADTIRPALQLIKAKPGINSVSGLFFMALNEEILLFADCAVTPEPDAITLAQIAKSSAESAEKFGIQPRIAMLSYSTGQSGSGKSVEVVRDAVEILKSTSELKVDGPLQYDAASNIAIASIKAPNSNVAGYANVFIFPDLNSANICYKAVQHTSNALAIGPILQGLNAPVNDLSRGAFEQDIINTILITAIQAGEKQ